MIKKAWDALSWLFVIVFGLLLGFVIGVYLITPMFSR